jgi:hypothetical protein
MSKTNIDIHLALDVFLLWRAEKEQESKERQERRKEEKARKREQRVAREIERIRRFQEEEEEGWTEKEIEEYVRDKERRRIEHKIAHRRRMRNARNLEFDHPSFSG